MPRMLSVADELNALFAPQWLRTTARECGAIKRFVKVDIVVFFWTLLLGPTSGAVSSLASLQRRFEAPAGIKLAPSSFLGRFSPGLVCFLRACLKRVVTVSFQAWAPPAIFRHFADVLVQDSTMITLADALARVFPGVKTKAAVKVNAIYSVLRGDLRSLVIAAGTKGEPRFVRITRALEGVLLLLDLGYFSWDIFGAIDRVGAFFVSRVKKSVNPLIVRDFHTGPGRTRSLCGLKLREALRGLLRDELDVEVEVTAREKVRGRTAGSKKTVSRKVRFRVVGVRHPESGELYLYLTNVSPDVFAPRQVHAAYTARWMGELLWREMKSTCQMRELPSRRADVVRALVLTAAIRLMVNRVLLDSILSRAAAAAQRQFSQEQGAALMEHFVLRMGPERFAAVWRDLSVFYLAEVLRRAGIEWNPAHLDELLLSSMLDPNRSSDSLRRRLLAA